MLPVASAWRQVRPSRDVEPAVRFCCLAATPSRAGLQCVVIGQQNPCCLCGKFNTTARRATDTFTAVPLYPLPHIPAPACGRRGADQLGGRDQGAAAAGGATGTQLGSHVLARGAQRGPAGAATGHHAGGGAWSALRRCGPRRPSSQAVCKHMLLGGIHGGPPCARRGARHVHACAASEPPVAFLPGPLTVRSARFRKLPRSRLRVPCCAYVQAACAAFLAGSLGWAAHLHRPQRLACQPAWLARRRRLLRSTRSPASGAKRAAMPRIPSQQSPLLSLSPTLPAGLRIGLYTPIKSLLGAEGGQGGLAPKVAAGMLAGALAAGISNPTDLVKTHMQKGGGAGGGPFAVLARVVRQDGVRGLWVGTTPSMVSEHGGLWGAEGRPGLPCGTAGSRGRAWAAPRRRRRCPGRAGRAPPRTPRPRAWLAPACGRPACRRTFQPTHAWARTCTLCRHEQRC